jgi:GntP family gluconate:H+ symporter
MASTLQGTSFLLTVAILSVIALLLLVVFLRVHAFASLVLVSFVTAIVTGIPFDQVVPTMLTGFGGTLASVALLVGLGAMIGKILEVSGGANVLADTLIGRFGRERAPLALGVASLVFGFPIFFDAGLIVMMPVIFSVAARFGGPVLIYTLPAAGAFAAMHALVPPHPGPVAAAELLGADIGRLVLVGLAVALPAWYVGGYLYGVTVGRKFPVELGEGLFAPVTVAPEDQPGFATVFALLLLPILLISIDSVISTLASAGVVDTGLTGIALLQMIGKTPIALLITLLTCLLVFSKTIGMTQLEKLCGESLGPICAVVLVTGAGGMYGGVLRAAGVGDALYVVLADTGLPVIVSAFVIATCLRIAQGSATVALTTTAAIVSPMVAQTSGLSEWDLCLIVIAIAGGATVLSHFNDSGFWLVSRLFNIDAKTTLATWTVMVTLIGAVAFAMSFGLSLIV